VKDFTLGVSSLAQLRPSRIAAASISATKEYRARIAPWNTGVAASICQRSIDTPAISALARFGSPQARDLRDIPAHAPAVPRSDRCRRGGRESHFLAIIDIPPPPEPPCDIETLERPDSGQRVEIPLEDGDTLVLDSD